MLNQTELSGCLTIQYSGAEDEILGTAYPHLPRQTQRTSSPDERRRFSAVPPSRWGRERAWAGLTHPGMIPSLVSVNPSLAPGPATLTSVAKANSSPPPSAVPSKAEMLGTSSRSKPVKALRNPSRKSFTCEGDIDLRSLRSAPAQNVLGTRERTTSTRVLASQ